MENVEEALEKENSLTSRQISFLKSYELNDCLVGRTCKAIGMSLAMYKRWLLEDDFKEAIDLLDQLKIEGYLVMLDDKAKKGNIVAILGFLNAKGKKEGFGMTNSNEKPQVVNAPVQINYTHANIPSGWTSRTIGDSGKEQISEFSEVW